jgi:uncharacterized protein (DUF58 family)
MAQPQRVRSRIRLTWQGVFWILLAAVLLTQGWYRSIGLLAFLAFFLIGLMALHLLYIVGLRRGLNRLRITRRLPEAIVAGEPFFVEVEIQNPGPRQVGLRLEDRVEIRAAQHADGSVRLRWCDYVGQLRRGERLVRRVQQVLPRRGRYRWSDLCVSTGFPLGLCRREARYECSEERIVWPAVGQVNLLHLQTLLEWQHSHSAIPRPWHRPLPGAEFEFHGLREYRSGDSPRYVHWRSSARTGKLLVREMEPPASDDLVLVLEARQPQVTVTTSDAANFDLALEQAISLAASIVLAMNQQPGRRIALVLLEEEIRTFVAESATPDVRRLLDALALVQGNAQPVGAFPTSNGGSVPDWPGLALPYYFRHAPVLWVTTASRCPDFSKLPLPVALCTTAEQARLAGWYNPPIPGNQVRAT